MLFIKISGKQTEYLDNYENYIFVLFIIVISLLFLFTFHCYKKNMLRGHVNLRYISGKLNC